MLTSSKPLVLAGIDNKVEIRALTIQHLVHNHFAGYIVDFATRKVVVGCQFAAFIVAEPRKFALPDALLGFNRRLIELQFEQEAAFESWVKVIGKVGGGNQNAVKFFKLFKDYVLNCIFCLSNVRRVDILALAEQCVGLLSSFSHISR